MVRKTVADFFLDREDEFRSHDGRTAIFSNIATTFGFQNLTFCTLESTYPLLSEKQLATTYHQDWCERYFEQSYAKIDPLVTAARKATRPIKWSSVQRPTRAATRFIKEAADHGIGEHGVAIPIVLSKGNLSLLTIQVSSVREVEQLNRPAKLADLVSFAHLVGSRMSFSKPANANSPHAPLTPREIEVLHWAAKGKSCWETGEILNLSERTVGSYVENARRKLDATSKTHAVVLALASGSIQLEGSS